MVAIYDKGLECFVMISKINEHPVNYDSIFDSQSVGVNAGRFDFIGETGFTILL